jgi:Transposase IS116/IS110/IS902 family.
MRGSNGGVEQEHLDRCGIAKELVAYVGVDPQREESGDREANRSISKRGNPRTEPSSTPASGTPCSTIRP